MAQPDLTTPSTEDEAMLSDLVAKLDINFDDPMIAAGAAVSLHNGLLAALTELQNKFGIQAGYLALLRSTHQVAKHLAGRIGDAKLRVILIAIIAQCLQREAEVNKLMEMLMEVLCEDQEKGHPAEDEKP